MESCLTEKGSELTGYLGILEIPIFGLLTNKVEVRLIFGQPGNPNLGTHLGTANKKATCETIV